MRTQQVEQEAISLSEDEMTMARRRLAECIAGTELVAEPFHHAEVDGILPVQVYAKLVAAMRAETFVPVDSIASTVGYEKRHVLQFDTHAASSESRNPEFWANFTRGILFHPEVITAFVDRFAPYTAFRSAVAFAAKPRRVTLHAIQDTGDYALPPHTDLCRKLATMLIYLPDVSGSPGEGTVLFRPKDPSFTCRHGITHHDPRKFEACGTAAYIPNHAFMFARTDRSFHGVRRLPSGSRRHLLQLTVQRLDVSDIYPEVVLRS